MLAEGGREGDGRIDVVPAVPGTEGGGRGAEVTILWSWSLLTEEGSYIKDISSDIPYACDI